MMAFMLVTVLVGGAMAEEILQHLPADDECSSADSTCALDALQRRGLKLESSEATQEEESWNELGGKLCIRTNFYYKELSGKVEMAGTGRTQESDWGSCQARCFKHPGCYRFSFWHDGGCLLTGYGATPMFHHGVTSGPRVCPGSSESASPSEGGTSAAPDSAWIAANANYTAPPTEYIGFPDAWDTNKVANGMCDTVTRWSNAYQECYAAVEWARTKGIYEKPENYPGLLADVSSVEEFQFYFHHNGKAKCPPPCLLEYAMYSTPSFREPGYRVLKGVSYGAAPLKSAHSRLTSDDFMADITGAQLYSWGRGDMNLMKDLGANAMRMYGNDAETSHRTFLDEAMKLDMDVIAGMSDFGFIQGPNNCILNDYYCFEEAHFYYKKNLLKGFVVKNFTTYHPALKALIMANEPDLKTQPRWKLCRATASIFDAILEAEKEVGVTENLIALTFTWSFANFHGKGGVPALGQMEDFWKCIHNPSAPPSSYTPKNDLVKAFKQRFVNSFNTANTAHEVEQMILNKYGQSSFWTDDMKIPVFIGEYHSIRHGMKDDLTDMMSFAKSPKYPFFKGYSFFEFSKRYDKGGSEAEFGMFGYGDCILMDMNYSGQVYTIWNLKPETDKDGYPLVKALKNAFGTGRELPNLQTPHLPCRMGTMGVP